MDATNKPIVFVDPNVPSTSKSTPMLNPDRYGNHHARHLGDISDPSRSSNINQPNRIGIDESGTTPTNITSDILDTDVKENEHDPDCYIVMTEGLKENVSAKRESCSPNPAQEQPCSICHYNENDLEEEVHASNNQDVPIDLSNTQNYRCMLCFRKISNYHTRRCPLSRFSDKRQQRKCKTKDKIDENAPMEMGAITVFEDSNANKCYGTFIRCAGCFRAYDIYWLKSVHYRIRCPDGRQRCLSCTTAGKIPNYFRMFSMNCNTQFSLMINSPPFAYNEVDLTSLQDEPVVNLVDCDDEDDDVIEVKPDEPVIVIHNSDSESTLEVANGEDTRSAIPIAALNAAPMTPNDFGNSINFERVNRSSLTTLKRTSRIHRNSIIRRLVETRRHRKRKRSAVEYSPVYGIEKILNKAVAAIVEKFAIKENEKKSSSVIPANRSQSYYECFTGWFGLYKSTDIVTNSNGTVGVFIPVPSYIRHNVNNPELYQPEFENLTIHTFAGNDSSVATGVMNMRGWQFRHIRTKGALVRVPYLGRLEGLLRRLIDTHRHSLANNGFGLLTDDVIINGGIVPNLGTFTIRKTPLDSTSSKMSSSGRGYSNQQCTVSKSPANSQGSQPSMLDTRFGPSLNNSNLEQHSSNSESQNNIPQIYSQRSFCLWQNKNKPSSESNTSSLSGSDLDIYSDIENEQKMKASTSTSRRSENRTPNTDDESESEMVIDTEKSIYENQENCNISVSAPPLASAPCDVHEVYSPGDPTDSPSQQSLGAELTELSDEASNLETKPVEEQTDKVLDEDDSKDGCPNFSIYSRASKSMALTTDISLPSPSPHVTDNKSRISISIGQKALNDKIIAQRQLPSRRKLDGFCKKTQASPVTKTNTLYSDSEDENIVKRDTNSFAISDYQNLTEDILSEEERSYTPLLDEKPENQKGLEGLDTELISDEDRNDFDESRELKTASDGDALEINAKESELDFSKQEDSESVRQHKENNENIPTTNTKSSASEMSKPKEAKNDRDKSDKEKKEGKMKKNKDNSVENQENETNLPKPTFKKLSKTTRERNYRDKDKNKNRSSRHSRERSRSRSSPENKNSRKRKRKEIQRYNVRALIADKPRAPTKDQFGRDMRRSTSRSRNRSRSRSYTPPLCRSRSLSDSRLKRSKSVSRARSTTVPRRSVSKRRSHGKNANKNRKKRGSYNRRSTSSGSDRKSRPRHKKSKRSASKSEKRKKSKDRHSNRSRKASRVSKSPSRTRVHSCSKSVSPLPQRQRDWTPTFSRSSSSGDRGASPSWTPPIIDNNTQNVHNQNLTVILNNEAGVNRKKEKRPRDKWSDLPLKKRKRERTPPPSKEVFASGDNILVSVSFGNEDEPRENVVTTVTATNAARERKKKEATTAIVADPIKKKKDKKVKLTKKDIATMKPIAIIDLERSPYQEIPVTDDVIVLSDSDSDKQVICIASESAPASNYNAGPKTPPEPSVKFALLSKPSQLRAINNPLHDPEDIVEGNAKPETDDVLSPVYKGPNTPPEPPMSPTSPDAYDPSKPTKSRSPTPQPSNQRSHGSGSDKKLHENLDNRSNITILENIAIMPDGIKSLTPPIVDIQTTDSQSSIQEIPEIKSPEQQRIGVIINQVIQPLPNKLAAQNISYNSGSVSAGNSSNMAHQRNVSVITTVGSQSVGSQRIVLQSQSKSQPPMSKSTVKSGSSKSLQSKTHKSQKRNKSQNGNGLDNTSAEIESPYSPGSSDYDDLFEPPKPTDQHESSSNTAAKTKGHSKSKSIIQKHQSTFDALFGTGNYTGHKNKNTEKKSSASKKLSSASSSSKPKQIGVKLDEDCLKILEDLPNSAVEMQVKDKFLKKLNRQERVVEEVKLVLKPYYNKKKISKDEYKDIMRRAVPKICHNKSGEINPIKIRNLIEAYVKKIKHNKKLSSSSVKNA